MDADIKTPQDALEWLDRSIREEAELDGEMSNIHAIQLGFIQNMLAKFPHRNCDVGTVEEQRARFEAWCEKQPERYCKACAECPTQRYAINCFCKWAQMPYEPEEGGDR